MMPLGCVRWIAAAASAVLLLGGAASSPARSDPLRIGVLEDMSGLYSQLTGKGQVVAAQMAIDDSGGSVLGRPVELVSADHQNQPDVASAIARRWYDTDGVQIIAGLGNSSVALAVQGIAREKGRIDIVTSAGTSALTGSACSPTGFQWAFNTDVSPRVIAGAVSRTGAKTWYFITADYTFGLALEATATKFVLAAGGKVLGSSKAPIDTSDFSSYLLQAQSSGAQVIGLANGGEDTVNSIKQAHEFGLMNSGQRLAGLSVYINQIHELGLTNTQGLYSTESFYWNLDDRTRAWSQRYFAKMHEMPNMLQAAIYGGITHYLQAVKSTGTDDGRKVAAAMHAAPVDDFYTRDAVIRADGMVVRPMYLFKTKLPAESKGPWDLLDVVATVPGPDAFGTQPDPACTRAVR